jgi:hypothetical protein
MSKPIPAIVIQAVEADLDGIRQQLHVELAGERDDVKIADRHEAETARHSAAAAAARESARQRRLRIGALLAKARVAWPKAGPNAKGWGAFVKEFGISEDSALRYMSEAKGDLPQTRTVAGNRTEAPVADRDDDGQYGAKDPVLPRAADAEPPPFRQLSESDLIQAMGRLDPEAKRRVAKVLKANALGGSGETDRGTWCTPKPIATAVGPWDVDPFSNPRSHVLAANRCMLENSGDGFGDGSGPGSYRVANREAEYAGPDTRVWLQPPYEIVLDVVDHYKHTRFCALLRWSPDVVWFKRLWPHVTVVAFPLERIPFEPPPGTETSGGAPFPHALLYADERDVTDEVRAMCIVWRVDHSMDPPAAPCTIDQPPSAA